MTERNGDSDSSARSRVTDHLANERTYLAWLRTGIAIIALGFVVAKFGLIVHGLFPLQPQTPFHFSSIIGVALVVAGGLMDLLALRRFVLNQKRIKAGIYEPTFGTEMIISSSIFVIAVLLIAYLLLTL